jgi:hypothetical protein
MRRARGGDAGQGSGVAEARGRAKASWPAGTRRRPSAGGDGSRLGSMAAHRSSRRCLAGVCRTAKATGLPAAAAGSRRPSALARWRAGRHKVYPAGGRPRHGGPRTTAVAAWWRPSRAPARRGPRWSPANPRCGRAAGGPAFPPARRSSLRLAGTPRNARPRPRYVVGRGTTGGD